MSDIARERESERESMTHAFGLHRQQRPCRSDDFIGKWRQQKVEQNRAPNVYSRLESSATPWMPSGENVSVCLDWKQ